MQRSCQGQLAIKLYLKKDPRFGKDKVVAALEGIKNVEKVRVLGDTDKMWMVDLTASKGIDVREEIFRKIVSMDMVLLELHQEETSLEDIFRKLTT